jgi:hypothetical protein
MENSMRVASEAAEIDPRQMSREQLIGLGHVKRSPMSVIRAKCLECCCGSATEVLHCSSSTCALWPYRTGKNPFTEIKGNPNPNTSGLQSARARKAAGARRSQVWEEA